MFFSRVRVVPKGTPLMGYRLQSFFKNVDRVFYIYELSTFKPGVLSELRFLQPQFFSIFTPEEQRTTAVLGLKKPPAREICSFETSVK